MLPLREVTVQFVFSSGKREALQCWPPPLHFFSQAFGVALPTIVVLLRPRESFQQTGDRDAIPVLQAEQFTKGAPEKF